MSETAYSKRSTPKRFDVTKHVVVGVVVEGDATLSRGGEPSRPLSEVEAAMILIASDFGTIDSTAVYEFPSPWLTGQTVEVTVAVREDKSVS